jgi:hypothetical protein
MYFPDLETSMAGYGVGVTGEENLRLRGPVLDGHFNFPVDTPRASRLDA